MVVALLAYLAGLCNASAFYDPGAQRWLNRDPMGELGGINTFEFVDNSPQAIVDAFGLDPISNQLPYPNIPVPVPQPGYANSPSGCGAGNGAVCKPSSQCIIGTYTAVSTYSQSCSNGGTQTCYKWKRCEGQTLTTFPKVKKTTLGSWVEKERCDPCPTPPCN